MAEIVTINNEMAVDFIKRNGAATTQEIASRFALSLQTAMELMDGLQEMGHVERAWRIGPLWRILDT